MKLVEVIADAALTDAVAGVAKLPEVEDLHVGPAGPDKRRTMRLLVADGSLQRILDKLQVVIGSQVNARILVLPVEAALPHRPEAEDKKKPSAPTAREVLYNAVEKDVRLDLNYLVLVALSTVVAAIGLVENNVAVVIGAMVIAPLLGPNLALALGTALGDAALVRKAITTGAVGIALAIGLSIVLGALWPFPVVSAELLTRTDVGPSSIALALAAGAAAVLSLTTGLPSVLVGVMVAVALLPPAAALGLTIGHGRFDLAAGAALLLAVNVVCLNLASKLVFLLRGIRPRTWWAKEKARRANMTYLVIWALTLIVLVLLIYARQSLAR
ncbi:MAG: TIGR00341 family protein [Alphaproteobacteria bacterium]|nr:TIGR00341 family protein [Alphaproteobacteria bacterium]